MRMPKREVRLYLSAETDNALREYQRVHGHRFANLSQAADHLLARALSGPIAEGVDTRLAPAIREAVLEACLEANDRLERELKGDLDRHTNRLASLLVKVGIIAGAAARIGRHAVYHLRWRDADRPGDEVAWEYADSVSESARTWGVGNMKAQLRENERELRDEIRRSGVLMKR
ncbi:MAG: hypothetical protein M3Q29_05520 [Chloroflexota bacterium]|nr:hypothetical protein [Chloroflexota bacterium]